MRLAKKIFLYIGLLFCSSLYQVHSWLNLDEKYVAHRELFFIEISCVVWLFLSLSFLKIYQKQLLKSNPRHFSLKNNVNKTGLFYFILGLVSSLLLSYLISKTMHQLPDNQIVINQASHFYPLLMKFSVLLFSPTLEELVNRGIFFNLFFNKDSLLSSLLAIFVSGLTFGLLHEMSFSYPLLVYCSFGWLLGIVYIKTKNLVFPILLHMFVNIL